MGQGQRSAEEWEEEVLPTWQILSRSKVLAIFLNLFIYVFKFTEISAVVRFSIPRS